MVVLRDDVILPRSIIVVLVLVDRVAVHLLGLWILRLIVHLHRVVVSNRRLRTEEGLLPSHGRMEVLVHALVLYNDLLAV